jgi:hypothetical protein
MIKTKIARKPNATPMYLAAFALAGGMASTAHAFNYQLNPDTSLDWDTTLSYSLAWRVENRDRKLVANADGNDGNNAFKKGDLINNRVGFLSEANLRWREDFGVFIRAAGYYDNVYDQSNANSTGSSNCFAAGLCSKPNRYSSDTIDQHREDLRLLDAYVYGTWKVADRNLNLRLGDQVVSWGESMFYPGISGAQSPVDATKSTTPGVEVKEILLPVGQLFAQYSLTESINLQAYYQYEWAETELFGVGSYFSTTDYIDEGGYSDASGTVRRLKDDKPSDTGQYGVAVTFASDFMNGTEFGLYYSRYHDKTPTLDFQSDLGFYRARYFSDIDQYGASFATVLGDTSLAGEVSYRDGQPVMVDNGFSSAVRAKTLQSQVSITHVVGPTSFTDNLTLVGEVVQIHVLDNDSSTPVTLFPGFTLPGSDQLVGDRNAWGFTAQAMFDYNNVFNGWDMTIPISLSVAANGDSAITGSINNGAHDNRMSIGSTWRYLNNFTVEARYNAYLGNANNAPLADRDNVALNFKYRF